MKNAILTLAVGGLLLVSGGRPSLAEDAASAQALKIDIPVDLKEAKVLFNMDHPAFAGDASIGLTYMKLMTQNFDRSKTKYTIKSVFHGAMGYMLLNDTAYNKVRKTDKGNPFKEVTCTGRSAGFSPLRMRST